MIQSVNSTTRQIWGVPFSLANFYSCELGELDYFPSFLLHVN